ncbi:hypothetical protein C8J57DRAFT_1215960 [Mycena rebaudengoi]|nr:hypothetical protein C8J57DRAFT_1215960 [Mycena rebaudengoi]
MNIKEGVKHQLAFDVFTAGLEREVPEQVKEWRGWIATWESKQHMNSAELPYELQIAQEEFILTDDGVEVEREDTPSTFLAMGMGIKSEQRKLAIDVKALKALRTMPGILTQTYSEYTLSIF